MEECTTKGMKEEEVWTTTTQKNRSLSGFLEWFRRFSSQLSSEPGNSPSSLQSSEVKSSDSSTKSTLLSEGSKEPSATEVKMIADFPDSIRADGASHINVNRIDLSDRTMASMAFAVAMLAMGLAVLAVVLGQISERESRLAQQDMMLLKASLIAHGVSVNEDQLHSKEDK